MDFEKIEQLVSLLGKSERDADVKEMLSFHKLKRLPRADEGDNRGWGFVSIDSKASKRFGFQFDLAENIENYPKDSLEGELIFTCLFYYPAKQDVSSNIDLPFGVKIQANREEQFKNLGEPSVRDDDRKYYSWKFGKLNVAVEYKKDSKTILQMFYFIDEDIFWQPEGGMLSTRRSNMNATVNTSDIVSLFGKSVDDPEVVFLMQEALGTLNRPQPDYENEDYYDWVMVRRKGVELGFEDFEYHNGADDALWGRGSLRLYQAYFYMAFDDVKTFQGNLPLGLDFKDSRDVVRKKMARYESTRHSFISDTWDTEQFRLNIRYTKNNRSIERMACYQCLVPIIRKFPLTFPSLSQIVDALGTDVRDPLFTSLWRKEDNKEIQDLVLKEGMRSVFMSRSYGVRLNFTGDRNEKQFYAITLLGHRQIESVNWEGELPSNLSFEDSPEVLFQKMKKRPDECSDDMEDNTDYAVWHFPKCTLFVGYSHLENRILRFKLYAPGVWESFKDREDDKS